MVDNTTTGVEASNDSVEEGAPQEVENLSARARFGSLLAQAVEEGAPHGVVVSEGVAQLQQALTAESFAPFAMRTVHLVWGVDESEAVNASLPRGIINGRSAGGKNGGPGTGQGSTSTATTAFRSGRT